MEASFPRDGVDHRRNLGGELRFDLTAEADDLRLGVLPETVEADSPTLERLRELSLDVVAQEGGVLLQSLLLRHERTAPGLDLRLLSAGKVVQALERRAA